MENILKNKVFNYFIYVYEMTMKKGAYAKFSCICMFFLSVFPQIQIYISYEERQLLMETAMAPKAITIRKICQYPLLDLRLASE
jgi:hypothetical protein